MTRETSGTPATRPDFSLLFLLLLAVPGCASRPGKVALSVDLTHGSSGTVTVVLTFEGIPGHSTPLSTFLQPQAVPLTSIEARQGATRLRVSRSLDERGFARYTVDPPPASGAITVTYGVRPGVLEEEPMSGPTGYRFGYFDARFGVFAARQIVLLPVELSALRSIEVRVHVPAELDLVSTWDGAGDSGVVALEGPDAAPRLLQSIVAVGRFDQADGRGGFRAFASRDLPDGLRGAALRRAVTLHERLASFLGGPGPYTIVLVPKAPDGASISVPAAPGGMAMSLGEGLPARWLTIGRNIGRALLDSRLSLGEKDTERAVLEALPTWLTLGASDEDGWRSRQEWLELFYDNTAGLDERDPDQAPDSLRREWRTTLALDLLSRRMEDHGLGSLSEACRKSLGARHPLDWDRFVRRLPTDLGDVWRRASAPSPRPFPFPGTIETDRPLRLPAPTPIAAGASGVKRIDLYFGARNMGLLEQCGCRVRQMGGMARRATLLRRRLNGAVPSLAVELGDAIPFDQWAPLLNPQRIVESDLVLSLMAFSGEVASVVSHGELAYGPDFLRRRIAALPRGFGLLSANIVIPGVSLPSAFERHGVRVVGLLDPSSYNLGRAVEYEDATARVSFRDPAEALRADLEVRPSTALAVAAGSLGPSAVMSIHRLLPDLPIIVTTDYFHFNEDPRITFERQTTFSTFGMLDRTLLVVLQSDAYALVRLGIALDPAGRIVGAELEDLPLDESVPDDPHVRVILDAHYGRLASESGLQDAPPVGGALQARLDAGYVGASACAECHAAETRQWKSTPHATSFATLLARRRQGVPGCYACHVTGYRQPGGYRAIRDRGLRNVQCEACHGPGGRHIKSPVRQSIVRTPTASICMECHTQKHSEMNDANLSTYWAKIVHAPQGGPV